jgi:hypothetical protein
MLIDIMKQLKHTLLLILFSGLCAWPGSVRAQYFSYGLTNGDVLAGFRKTGANQGNYELVVNLGSITDFLAVGPGQTISITKYSAAQLSAAFPDGFGLLQWSVSMSYAPSRTLVTPLGTFPKASIWYTLPRVDPNTETMAPLRASPSAQAPAAQKMISVGNGAIVISSQLGTTNSNNNTLLVREPASSSDQNLSAFIADLMDPTLANFNGTLQVNVENLTPKPFTSPVRSDFYQQCSLNNPDPITTRTTGPAYRVGYFQLNPDGTMSFTRASTNPVVPPPPPELSIARAGTTTTISVDTTNGATYVLHYTNSAGLSTSVTSWPSSPSTVSGDGTTKSFTDTSADADRVYRVLAH